MELAIDSHEAPRHVGVAPRAVAAVIDAIISVVVFLLPLMFLLGEEQTVTSGAGTLTEWAVTVDVSLAWITLTMAYFIIFEALAGATVGKLVLSLRVRDSGGTPIGFDAAFLRNVMRIVDCFPYIPLPYLLGAVSIWVSKDRQRLGDRVADTIVTWR